MHILILYITTVIHTNIYTHSLFRSVSMRVKEQTVLVLVMLVYKHVAQDLVGLDQVVYIRPGVVPVHMQHILIYTLIYTLIHYFAASLRESKSRQYWCWLCWYISTSPRISLALTRWCIYDRVWSLCICIEYSCMYCIESVRVCIKD